MKISYSIRRELLLANAFLLISLIPGSAQFNEECLSALDSMINMEMDRQQIPGLAIGIQSGELSFLKGYGYADLENQVPINPEHAVFRIGSISKTLTAATLAILYGQGKLDLDAPIQKYYPDFPEKGTTLLTVKHVAGHLGGIRHYKGLEFMSNRRYTDVRSALTIFENDPLLFNPGEKYSYSSYGYNLLSKVVENISDRPFLKAMDSLVFVPLGLLHTEAEFAESITLGRVRYYMKVGTTIQNCPVVDNSYKWAGGGFISTVPDLLLFTKASVNGTYMNEGTMRLFTETQKTNAGIETGYGMGWRNAIDDFGRNWIGHGGGSVGGTSIMMIYPEQDIHLVVLTNISQADLGFSSRIVDLVVRHL